MYPGCKPCLFQRRGLAVLTGNIARNGCIVKTAGVDESLFVFRGRAKVFESQEQAMNGILNDEVKAGDVVVIRYEGPKGGPGMQEMLYPTSYLKSKHLDKACALITDGRFSGGTSGLSIVTSHLKRCRRSFSHRTGRRSDRNRHSGTDHQPVTE